MKIAYVNTWGGFEENDYPNTCFFSRILREIDPQLKVAVGYSNDVDLVISMYTPIIGSATYCDLKKVRCKTLCFTGESYDIVSTTPNADAYIGFDDEQVMVGDYKYLRFPLYAAYHMNNLATYGCSTFEELRDIFKKHKKAKMSCVVSNPSNAIRNSVIQVLVANGFCDSGGKVYNNVGNIENKLEFISGYIIGMAFENLIKQSYVTEKVYDVFAVGSIPFYYGSLDVSKEFNPDSFLRLDVTNDSTIVSSIEEAIAVLHDQERINRMLSVDPITGFRSEKYIRQGKEILKNFIMNIVESK